MKLILIAAVASLTLPGLAAAQPNNAKNAGSPPNAAKKSGGTPPGLATKPHAMPPGQAKKMWSAGERLPRNYYTESRYYVTNPSAYSLPAAPVGSRWVKVGDRYYLTQTNTGTILNMISALTR